MNRINLTKIQRCEQVWEDMREHGCGRICQQCEKTIIDFREMSNEEVANVHIFSREAVCGVYRPEQLEMPSLITMPPKRLSRWKTAALTLLGFLSSTACEDTPYNSGTDKTHQVPTPMDYEVTSNNVSTDENRKEKKYVVTGQVFDENKKPLEGAIVKVFSINKTYIKKGITTDANGLYSLELTDLVFEIDEWEISLLFLHVGFREKLVVIKNTDFQAGFPLQLESITFDEEALPVIAFGVAPTKED